MGSKKRTSQRMSTSMLQTFCAVISGIINERLKRFTQKNILFGLKCFFSHDVCINDVCFIYDEYFDHSK